MERVNIQQARRFSLEGVQRQTLTELGDLTLVLLCFEAGQQDAERTAAGSTVYQVLEGEALVRAAGSTERLGKGKLLTVGAGTAHIVENAGGGLLVVLAMQAV